MNYGSMAIDDGHFFFTDEEKKDFLIKEPKAQKYFRQILGGYEFINNEVRWCLWLEKITPSELRDLPLVTERVKKVKEFRSKSRRDATIKLASSPTLFGEIRQPNTEYILIPKVSSENRDYIPIGILDKNIVASGSCLIIPTSSLFYFGILTSKMHTSWMKYTCGRMKSDFQYSASIVYNNFPFPESPTDKQKEKVEEAVKKMLAVRDIYFQKGSTLADLYDPVAMPKDLTDAHKQIDDAVDACYRKEKFTTELNRLEYLFELYKKYTAGLFTKVKPKRKAKL